MPRDEALALPNTEPSLSGRCVLQLQWDDDLHGTTAKVIWHNPTWLRAR